MMRMSTRKIFYIFLFVSLSACSNKKPFSTAREINQECMLEMQTAVTAIRLRDRGKSKQQLAKALPPLHKNSSRLLVYMHEILDETFQYQDLNEIIYPTYRFELCTRQLTNKSHPYNITKVYPALISCQQKFGQQASPEGTACIVESFKAK